MLIGPSAGMPIEPDAVTDTSADPSAFMITIVQSPPVTVHWKVAVDPCAFATQKDCSSGGGGVRLPPPPGSVFNPPGQLTWTIRST
jgi:hypothetical protein